jgi:hypothetical protein
MNLGVGLELEESIGEVLQTERNVRIDNPTAKKLHEEELQRSSPTLRVPWEKVVQIESSRAWVLREIGGNSLPSPIIRLSALGIAAFA